MIRENIDWSAAREEFSEKGYVRIDNIFLADIAEKVHHQLATEVPWGMKLIGKDGPIIFTQQEREALKQMQWAALNKEILWAFENRDPSYFYLTAGLNELKDEASDVVKFVSTGKFVGFVKYVSSNLEINGFGGQAACYRRNCFLTIHHDEDKQLRRKVTFIFNFTKDWKTEWGGLLHILDKDKKIIDVFQPDFNSLTLFKVPRDHFVSAVVPYASQDPLRSRYTITGWYIKTPNMIGNDLGY